MNHLYDMWPQEEGEVSSIFRIVLDQTSTEFKKLFEWMANNGCILNCWNASGQLVYKQDYDAHVWMEGIKRMSIRAAKKIAEEQVPVEDKAVYLD